MATAKTLLKHFIQLTGNDPLEFGKSEPDLSAKWYESCKHLINTSSMPPEEIMNFMTWAVTENVNDNPKFNSVAYIAKANDPMATLMKHSENLLRVYGTRKVVSNKVAAATKKAEGKPLPLNVTEWLMDGPGINRPLKGWDSARQKLDSIKKSWYGDSWQSQPDPTDFEALEERFKDYQKNLGITPESDDE